MSPSREGAFDFGNMSHVLFVLCAINSRVLVPVAFTSVGDDPVVERLMMLRVLPGFSSYVAVS